MRNGFRVIDTDTHVGPTADTLYDYASKAFQSRRNEMLKYEVSVRDGIGLSIGPYPYKRQMGQRTKEELAVVGGTPTLKGQVGTLLIEPPETGVQVRNSIGRLRDMDREGRDIDLVIPGTFSTAITAIEPDLALELYAAYNRYIVDYCSADPSRLKATLLAPAHNPGFAASEIAKYASEKCIGAVAVPLPEGLPVDDPDLHVIWRAMGDADLPLLHHSFFYEPPYFPGYRDVWGHIAVARASAHVWGAQRLLSYLLLSGLFDQFPVLRVGFSECSSGWLPSWLNRLQSQSAYLAGTLPTIKHTPLEYAQNGRVFCGVELAEGEVITRSVIEAMGDGSLMYSSDYPHDQSKFPSSVDLVLGWDIPESSKRAIMSENAERYLRLI